jgi:hypothetical protein
MSLRARLLSSFPFPILTGELRRRLLTTKILTACAFLLAISCSLQARADVLTTYDINFTGVRTLLPTSGSFTYDSTIPQFTNFIVDWGGDAFDMTSTANNPSVQGSIPPCVGANTGAAATFAILSTCSDSFWFAMGGMGDVLQFDFENNLAGCESVGGPCEFAFAIGPDPGNGFRLRKVISRSRRFCLRFRSPAA